MRSYRSIGEQINRIPVLVAVFVIVAVAIVLRLFYLQVIRHDYYFGLAANQHLSKDTIPAKRGKIFAMDTLSDEPYLIATNQSLDLVYVNPKEIKDKEKVATALASALDMKKEEILEKISDDKSYVPIKRKVTKSQSDKVKRAKLAGVGAFSENWRYYPEGSFASSILGFVNNENKGNYGLEEKFNELLSGTPGQLKEETDSLGIKIAFGNNVLKSPKDGQDIYLTIDRYVQQKAESILNDSVKKFSAKGGTVIVMEPETGKILALANNPTFDPNKYSEVKDYEIFKNKAVSDTYEPGSIFKVITLGAGVDAGKITPDTLFTDTGSITLDGHKIMNSDKKAHGVCTMTKVLEESLNTGTTWVGQQLGKDKFYEYLKKFGFGELTNIDLPGEVEGVVYPPKALNDHGYATMSFGQSISTTPIQMLSSFATVANKGKMMQPFVVSAKTNDKGKKEETKPREVTTVMSENASNDLIKMMVSVTVNGHGKQAQVKGYQVAGKTGTAQVVKKDGTGYEEGKNIGSFVGFAPAYDAKFVVLAKVDEPKNVAWAESTAAPIVGQMLDFLLKYYQVPPTEKM